MMLLKCIDPTQNSSMSMLLYMTLIKLNHYRPPLYFNYCFTVQYFGQVSITGTLTGILHTCVIRKVYIHSLKMGHESKRDFIKSSKCSQFPNANASDSDASFV